jgi:hypothetical protein
MDDPDARLEAAEPVTGPLLQAGARRKPSNPRAAYHQPLDPDHEDDLLLSIGQGLALVEARERQSPAATIRALAAYVDAVRAGSRRLTRDPTDAALALACTFGHQICRDYGWGWAHLRRARSPGIVLVSPDFRHVLRPRKLIDRAFRDGGDVLVKCRTSLGSELPSSAGFYVPVA